MSILAHGSIVNRVCIGLLVVLFMSGFTAVLEPQQPVTQAEAIQQTLDRRIILVDLQGPIGPATMEFLIDSLQEAAARNTELLIIRMNTPGGLDSSTRGIIKAILNSPVPVTTFVATQGASARIVLY